MKKIKLRALAIALCIMMVLPLMSSAVYAGDEIEGVDMYYGNIVYPANANKQTKDAAKALCEYLKTYCRTDSEVVQDIGNKPIAKEIVIGRTNRPAGKDVQLGEKDWYVCTDGEKIYIDAGSEGLLPLAIEWFKHNCLINGSRKAYVGEGYFYQHDYSSEGLCIDGADGVVIAYSNNDHVGYVDVAYSLTYAVMEYTGYPLEVRGYTAASEAPQLVILSTAEAKDLLPDGVSIGASQYAIFRSGKDVVIAADSSIGAEIAVQRIAEMLRAGGKAELSTLCSGTPVTYSLTGDPHSLSDGAELRIMSINPGRYTLNPVNRCDEIRAALAYYSPDVVGFQEFCDYFSRHMEENGVFEKCGYTVIGKNITEKLPENEVPEDNNNWKLKYNMTPIIYKTDRFDCVASGWERLDGTYDLANGRTYYGHQVTWAVLKDKATGETFGVSSTHFFHLNNRDLADPVRAENAKEIVALIGDLQKQYGCPFVSMGDYNSYKSDEAYKILEGSELFEDSRNVAVQEYGAAAAGHKYGVVKPASYGTERGIDLFFVTEGVRVLCNKIVANELGASIGDHFPVYVDVDLGEAGNGSEGAYQPADTASGFEGIPTFSASDFTGAAASGSTTVAHNGFTVKVDAKTEAPLEKDEFWEMKNPPDEPENDGTGEDDTTQQTPPTADDTQTEEKGGCSSLVGTGVLLVSAMAACACLAANKKEND